MGISQLSYRNQIHDETDHFREHSERGVEKGQPEKVLAVGDAHHLRYLNIGEAWDGLKSVVTGSEVGDRQVCEVAQASSTKHTRGTPNRVGTTIATPLKAKPDKATSQYSLEIRLGILTYAAS